MTAQRCPHCGHAYGEKASSFMAMQDTEISARTVLWLALFIAGVVLTIAGVHGGVLFN